MSKKTLRIAAILVSLCFILTIAPVLNSAEKKSVSTASRILSLMKKPLFLLGSLLNLFPYPPVLYDNSSDRSALVVPSRSNKNGLIKTTGDSNINPPGNKD